MKLLTTTGLTKLIEIIKSTFIKNTDVETTTELDVAEATSLDVATVTTIGIESTPTSASTNLVTSGGVYSALQDKQDLLTTISGYDATVAQTLQHDSSGALCWINN